MHESKDIARAYQVEGEVDIKMARISFDNLYYSRCVFFAQQSAEKMIKACLVVKGVITKEHNISPLFGALYKDAVEGSDGLLPAIGALERYGAKPSHPLFQRPDLPIWIPSRSIKEKEAQSALEKGELIFGRLTELLEKEFNGSKG